MEQYKNMEIAKSKVVTPPSAQAIETKQDEFIVESEKNEDKVIENFMSKAFAFAP